MNCLGVSCFRTSDRATIRRVDEEPLQFVGPGIVEIIAVGTNEILRGVIRDARVDQPLQFGQSGSEFLHVLRWTWHCSGAWRTLPRIRSRDSCRDAGRILNGQTGYRVVVMEPRVVHLWIYSICFRRWPIRWKRSTGIRRRFCVFGPAQFVVRDYSRVVMHRADFPNAILLDVLVLEDALLPLGPSSLHT